MSILKAAQLTGPPDSTARMSNPKDRHIQASQPGVRSWIQLTSLDVEAIIGIWPRERQVTQPLTIELELEVLGSDWLGAAMSGELERSVDYSQVAARVKEIAEQCRFRLVESLVYLIAYSILRPLQVDEDRATVKMARITVIKPNALRDSGGGVPSIRCEIERSALQQSIEVAQRELTERLDLDRFNDLLTGDESIQATPILALDEVTVVYLESSQAGLLSLRPHERLITLGDELMIDELTVSWTNTLSALHVTCHELADADPNDVDEQIEALDG